MIGLGPSQFEIAIYIGNRPDLAEYAELSQLRPLTAGEIAYIAQETGNHWRKVFNVSAKFLHALYSKQQDQLLPNTWQHLRDTELFQSHSRAALLFSAPDLSQKQVMHIVCGKTYANQLDLQDLVWLDNSFAIDKANKLIVCPYLDYRQLSNSKVDRLVELVLEPEKQRDVVLKKR